MCEKSSMNTVKIIAYKDDTIMSYVQRERERESEKNWRVDAI